MNKKKLKLKYANVIAIVFIFVFLGLIIYSSYKITHYIYNTKETEELTERLENFIEISAENEDDIKIDFDKLKEENSDTVAWIRVNNTNVNYPVVRGKDNDYYLKRNFNKKWSESGWIFSSFANKFDGTDDNIVIFGHAMKNKTMFGDLNKALEKDWIEDDNNRKIQLIVGEEVQIYKIFSVYKIEAEDYYITTNFGSTDELQNFITTIKDRSMYKFNDEVTTADKLLTLSTCYNVNNIRIAIHAYRIS